jgi:DNA-binding transcriptional LysR family regulator
VLSLRQLTHARTLAQLGNFRLASQVLHISQPALTRSIQALEASLGVPLFNRLAHTVEPTRFGEAFLPKAHLLLQVRDDLAREMKLLMELDQLELRISLGPYPFELHAAEVMAQLGSAHPGLQCRLRLDSWREVSAQVLKGESDLGVGDLTAAEPDGRLQTEGVGQHAVHLYCRSGHPMLAKQQLTLAELSGMTLAGTRGSVRLGSALGSSTAVPAAPTQRRATSCPHGRSTRSPPPSAWSARATPSAPRC